MITREPAGGIILTRSWSAADGYESRSELTIYNSRAAELAFYHNGKIKSLVDVRFRPSKSSDDD